MDSLQRVMVLGLTQRFTRTPQFHEMDQDDLELVLEREPSDFEPKPFFSRTESPAWVWPGQQ
jgi:hypothetical protein